MSLSSLFHPSICSHCLFKHVYHHIMFMSSLLFTVKNRIFMNPQPPSFVLHLQIQQNCSGPATLLTPSCRRAYLVTSFLLLLVSNNDCFRLPRRETCSHSLLTEFLLLSRCKTPLSLIPSSTPTSFRLLVLNAEWLATNCAVFQHHLSLTACLTPTPFHSNPFSSYLASQRAIYFPSFPKQLLLNNVQSVSPGEARVTFIAIQTNSTSTSVTPTGCWKKVQILNVRILVKKIAIDMIVDAFWSF